METLDHRLQKRMHVSLYALLFLTTLLGLSVLLEGCTDRCETTERLTYYEPVYTSFAEIKAATEVIDPQPVTSVGKIYIKDNYLFVNQPGKGIHIIDNADPASPSVEGFLNIPGNYDLAILDDILYADSYIDLVCFDISDVNNIREVSRVPNTFSYFNHDIGFSADPQRGVITGWEERKDVRVTKSDCNMESARFVICFEGGVAASDAASFKRSLAIAPGFNGSGPGVGGSMARFTINKNHLYALDAGSIQPFDLAIPTSPVKKTGPYIAWDIETIFPYRDKLFIGAGAGMHIVDITNPSNPVKISTWEHVRSCDPVVVNDTHAFVTLRSGTTCQGFTNQLEVLDITDATAPKLVKTYPMHNPHGLGIDAGTLFLCDGDAGLKIFDASDVTKIDQHRLAHYSTINAYDVIPFANTLVMIGSDGIFQYDYSNPTDIRLLSQIPVIDAD